MRNKKKLKQAILNVHVAVVILVITIVSISSSYFVKAEENNKKIIKNNKKYLHFMARIAIILFATNSEL